MRFYLSKIITTVMLMCTVVYGSIAVNAKTDVVAEQDKTLIYKVQRVVDGDTYVILAYDPTRKYMKVRKFRVRLHGVDTPEIWHPKCREEHKKALIARFFVRKLLKDKEVLVLPIEKDRYGRVVADITVLIRDSNQQLQTFDLGKYLVTLGFAKVWNYPKQRKPNFCD